MIYIKHNMKIIYLFCLFVILLPVAFDSYAEDAKEDDLIYVIPVRGQISRGLVYVVRRGINEAKSKHAGAMVFVMDTPGGRLDATTEIVRMLLNIDLPTYTFVEGQAFSAGSMIALSTDHIYMAPGSVIGAATPVMMSPMGGTEEMPEAFEEKSMSAVSALIRSAAQQKGHNPQLAEAFVRKDKQFKIGEKIISPKGELLTLTNKEAAQKIGKQNQPLLSEGTVKTFDKFLEKIGRTSENCITIKVTGAEKIARLISTFSFLLLAGGLLGVYIEFKTPGFGFPGIIGVLCLLIFFWGHHIAGLAGMEDLLIFTAGVILLLIELLFIPGFGITGFSGLFLILFGLLSAMMPHIHDFTWSFLSTWNFQKPFLVFASALILAGLAVYFLTPYLSESKILSRIVLNDSISREKGYEGSAKQDNLIGLPGRAATQLHPAGKGEFGEKYLDVVTRGEFFDVDTPIRITEVHGRRIIVDKNEENS
jgi:membrane-bound serine protease (ClpP class)